jgi:hypothetical protein
VIKKLRTAFFVHLLITRWVFYGVALISLNCEAGGSGVSYDRVIENPSRYHHKRVTLCGIATVQGSGFELRSLHDTSGWDELQVIIVGWRGNANYDRFNNKPVLVTGVIDAYERGHWYYRCGILLEKIAVLPSAPKKSASE